MDDDNNHPCRDGTAASHLQIAQILYARAAALAKVSGIPLVQRYRSKGRWYAYFRPTRQRIKSPWGSREFFIELHHHRHATGRLHSLQAETVATLIGRFETTDAFKRRPILFRVHFRQAAHWLSSNFTETALAEIDHRFAFQLRHRARLARGSHFANAVVALLQSLASFALTTGAITRNPFSQLRPLRYAPPKDRTRRRIIMSEPLRNRIVLVPRITLPRDDRGDR